MIEGETPTFTRLEGGNAATCRGEVDSAPDSTAALSPAPARILKAGDVRPDAGTR